jgi:hypothetical protein
MLQFVVVNTSQVIILLAVAGIITGGIRMPHAARPDLLASSILLLLLGGGQGDADTGAGAARSRVGTRLLPVVGLARGDRVRSGVGAVDLRGFPDLLHELRAARHPVLTS